MWEWLVTNNGVLALFVASAASAAALIQYFSIKRSEDRARKFSDYHQLLQDLNEGKQGGQYIDRQMAIIFELRNFESYYPVTVRILERSIATWGATPNDYLKHVSSEAQKNLDFIKRNSHRSFRKCISLSD